MEQMVQGKAEKSVVLLKMSLQSLGKAEKSVILLKMAQIALGKNGKIGDNINNCTNGARKSGKKVTLLKMRRKEEK
jgi:hypothetical protein